MDEFEAGYWRMVQRLQTTLVGNASVQRSKGRGHGLFAARDLARGEYITTYWGRLAYHSEVKGRPLRETTHMRTLILQFLLVDGERTVAPRNGIGLASFANNAGWSEEAGSLGSGLPRWKWTTEGQQQCLLQAPHRCRQSRPGACLRHRIFWAQHQGKGAEGKKGKRIFSGPCAGGHHIHPQRNGDPCGLRPFLLEEAPHGGLLRRNEGCMQRMNEGCGV